MKRENAVSREENHYDQCGPFGDTDGFFFLLPNTQVGGKEYRFSKKLWGGTQKDGKAFCSVNWKRVCKRREFESLGVINLRDFNMALLLKWWWKLFDDRTHKWAMLISQNYCPITGWWSDQQINRAFSFSF